MIDPPNCALCTAPATFRVHDTRALVVCDQHLAIAARAGIALFLERGIPGAVDPGELDVVSVSLLDGDYVTVAIPW
jgi:hypothetical protein